MRLEGYCRHEGEREHRHEDGWSRPVRSVETDIGEQQNVDPMSEQTPVPVTALTRISTLGLPDVLW